MRILVLHNYYQQPGGEDRVFESETAMLASRGHEIIRFVRHNDELIAGSSLKNFGNALWNRTVARDLQRLVDERRPEIAHVHNVFSVLSPAVYHVLRQSGIPVVQTLHNYRLACPNARLIRNGHGCTLCRGRPLAWPAIRHRCYQARWSSSVAIVSVLALHRLLRSWIRSVDLYVAPSDYLRRQMISAGLPAERIIIKPHFVADPGETRPKQGGHALFLGRLEPEKGIMELLEAWRLLPGFTLRVAGDGPLKAVIQERLRDPALSHVSMLGWLPRERVDAQLANARFLVIPALGSESFGITAIEAFSHAVPVLTSAAGALPEIVRDGVNGILVDPRNKTELAAQARRLFDDTPLWLRMARQARADYLSAYSPAVAEVKLLNAYDLARQYHRRWRRIL
jgi:glycosyltransferase involved in cell wall biosynthesis